MLLLKRLIAGFTALLRGRRAEQELDDELRAYLDVSSAKKIRSGMSPEAALRAARAEMGSVEAIKDYTRDVGWETASRAPGATCSTHCADWSAMDLSGAIGGLPRTTGARSTPAQGSVTLRREPATGKCK